MPPASTRATPLAHLVLIGAVLPAVFVALNNWLLGLWLRGLWSMVPLMAALVAEVGLLGLLCGNFVRPPWLMWLIYAWVWLVMDMMVAALATSDPGYSESISGNTLPVALLGGQLGLVLVWAALGQMRWTVRWPVALLLAVAIFIPIVWHKSPPTELLILVDLQVGILAAVCSLLALLRFRLARVEPEFAALSSPPDSMLTATLRENQFQLRDVLFWTTVLAIALAAARAVDYLATSLTAWEDIRSRLVTWGASAFLLGTPTSAMFTALVLLIALWAALGAGRPWLRWSLFATFIVAVGMAHGLIDYPQRAPFWRLPKPFRFPHNWSDFWATEQSLVAWHCLSGGMLFAALLILRTRGYRLCRPSGTQRKLS